MRRPCRHADALLRPSFTDLTRALSDALDSAQPSGDALCTAFSALSGGEQLPDAQHDAQRALLQEMLTDEGLAAFLEGRRPVPKKFDLCTIFFCDVCGHVALSTRTQPLAPPSALARSRAAAHSSPSRAPAANFAALAPPGPDGLANIHLRRRM